MAGVNLRRSSYAYGRFYWFRGLFTTGNKLSNPSNAAKHEEDSSVSAVLFMCALVCCGVVTHLCRFIPSKYEPVYPLLSLQVVRSILLILCIGLMLWFFRQRHIWKECGYLFWTSEPTECEIPDVSDHPSRDHTGDLHLSTKGIVVFGAGRMVLDTVYLIRTGNCLGVSVTPAKDFINFFYHMIYVVFILTQVVFLLYFIRATFKNCSYFRYAILYLFATNVCLWFISYIYGIRDVISPSLGPDGNYTKLNVPINATSDTLHLLHCAHYTTPIHDLIRDIEPYFYAFSLEYTLLAAGMLYHIWSAMKDVELTPQVGRSVTKQKYCCSYVIEFLRTCLQAICKKESKSKGEGDSLIASIDEDSDNRVSDLHPVINDASTTRLSRDQTSTSDSNDDVITEIPSADQGSDNRSETESGDLRQNIVEINPPSLKRAVNDKIFQSIKEVVCLAGVCFIVGMIFSIVLIVSAYLLFNPSPEERDRSLYEFYSIRILFYASLCVCCWVGFDALKEHDCKQVPFQEDTTLLIVSVNGSFLFIFFGITAAIGAISVGNYSQYPPSLPYIVILDCFINLVQCWLQVTFLVSSLRYFPARGQSIVRLQRIYSYLFICNFSMWVLDSFFETMAVNLSPVQKYYYGDKIWHIITDLTYPFGIFFRFHSFVTAYSVFVRFLHQQSNASRSVSSTDLLDTGVLGSGAVSQSAPTRPLNLSV